jgi:hypothetical protein
VGKATPNIVRLRIVIIKGTISPSNIGRGFQVVTDSIFGGAGHERREE